MKRDVMGWKATDKLTLLGVTDYTRILKLGDRVY